jgi:2-polyprenyl-3-methyl-5-hydroxy-6-metoxy-1,4-benzoquinol methylase
MDGSASNASGAEVVAVDCVALNTFLDARDLLDSRVEYLTLDVSELSAAKLGRFDFVLFFGVLYHLRHPCSVSKRWSNCAARRASRWPN